MNRKRKTNVGQVRRKCSFITFFHHELIHALSHSLAIQGGYILKSTQLIAHLACLGGTMPYQDNKSTWIYMYLYNDSMWIYINWIWLALRLYSKLKDIHSVSWSKDPGKYVNFTEEIYSDDMNGTNYRKRPFWIKSIKLDVLNFWWSIYIY